MTNEQNQIDILLNYKADFDTASKNLQQYLKSTEDRIVNTETKLAELVSKKSKNSKLLIENGKQELDLLYKQRNVLLEQYNVQNKLASQSGAMHKMLRANIDNEIKDRKALFSDLKSDILNRNKISTDYMRQWKQDTDTRITGRRTEVAGMRDYYKEVFNSQRYNSTPIEAKADRLSKKAETNTFTGSFTSGSSFGHKVGTTMQYAVAGTAIFKVAEATMALGKSVLEADLNMRTMSAVLGINIEQAKQLDASVRNLGETFGGTTEEIEQVALALGRAGVKTRDITIATEIVLKMARLTGDTFEQSASAVISFQQVFGNTTPIETLGNKLAYVANQSRLSTQDIGTFANYALAAAKDVGLTEDAVGGLAAAFSNAGVNASTIGTQIRRFTTLLTDNSEAVTSFFNTAGVSQEKLALQISRGGEDSNKAMMQFAKTLQGMDAQTFTKLTGQMDILAANSLALIRNNADNINQYMSDLQTGLAGQLDSVNKIVDATKVKIESAWNAIKNYAINNIDDITEWFGQKMDGIYYSWVDLGLRMNKVGQETLSLGIADTKNLDEKITKNQDMYNILAMGIELKKAESRGDIATIASIKAKIESENQRLGIIKDTKSQQDGVLLAENTQLDIAKQRLAVLSGNKDTLSDIEKREQKLLETEVNKIEKQREGKKVLKEQEDAAKGIFSSTQSRYEAIVTYASTELSLNKELTAATRKQLDVHKSAYSKELVEAFNTKIKETSKTTQSMFNNADVSAVGFGATLDEIKTKIENTKNATADKDTKKALEDDLAVIKSMGGVYNSILDVKGKENLFDAKSNSITEAKSRAQEQAQRKAETEAEKLRKYDEAKSQHLTSIDEISKQIMQTEDITLSKAESKFQVDSALLGVAYQAYEVAKGTTGEKAAHVNYLAAYDTYMKSSLTMLQKQAKLDSDRAALQLELNSSLELAIEGEQVRLGIIEKATDSEYEKLRVKIEQGKIDGLLKGEELSRQEARLAQLDELQRKKKDAHTLAMEYQREIQTQEELSYTVTKAGLASLESGMMDFFDVTSEGWLDWHKLASNVLSSIYKQLLEQLVIKQLVSGIAGGIGSMFSSGAAIGSYAGVTSSAIATSTPDFGSGGWSGNAVSLNANGGLLPSKGYANGGVLTGGSGVRDDIYLGNISGTQVFAMGGEFITRKDSVNEGTKSTLDYINKTGSVPSSNSQVNVPVSIKVDNQTGTNVSADMIQSLTQTNDKGEYEKVINIVLKASQTDPRIRRLLK